MQRWTATAEISRVPDKGDNIYLLSEKGDGSFSGFRDKISWLAQLNFESNKDTVRPLRMERLVSDKNGKLLARESQEFDFRQGKVGYKYINALTGQQTKKEIDFKGDIANRLMLGLYIQKFLENGRRRGTVYILSSEPRLYRVTIRIVGKEEVDVGGSKRQAYKLCLEPELGLLNVLKIVLPKAYVWHSSEPPFEWLRYRGLENDITSPRVEIKALN